MYILKWEYTFRARNGAGAKIRKKGGDGAENNNYGSATLDFWVPHQHGTCARKRKPQ